MRHWSSLYIGLPYKHYDCAELCVKVQKEVFDREISLPTERESGLRGISRQIRSLKDDFATPIPVPEEGDAVIMISRGELEHIGVVTFISGQLWILHAMRNAGQTVLHRHDALENLGLCIQGYYQWK